jgi:hypothetical protein
MSDSLPLELARRIEVLEREPRDPDFDAVSWMWLTLLGLALPIGLLVLGWWF